MVALCSKTYYCFGQGHANKFSIKGTQKQRNRDILNYSTYKECLETSHNVEAVNRGFRFIKDEKCTKTYEQRKICMTNIYVKGVVMEENNLTSISVVPAAFTFNSSLQIQLPQGNVFAVVVTAPGGATLIQGIDYSVDRANGIIAALAGGAISMGETVQIAYAYADEVIATAGQTAPTN